MHFKSILYLNDFDELRSSVIISFLVIGYIRIKPTLLFLIPKYFFLKSAAFSSGSLIIIKLSCEKFSIISKIFFSAVMPTLFVRNLSSIIFLLEKRDKFEFEELKLSQSKLFST